DLLRNKLSQRGITVMQNGIALNNTHRPLDLNEFRAFTLVDEYAPLIFINTLDSNNGKTFSLLHEVAHVFLGINSLYNDDFQQTEIFINLWNLTYSDEKDMHTKVMHIADYFKVSKLVIARKAFDQKYINQTQYNEIAQIVKNEFDKRNSRRGSGGNAINNARSR